MTNLRSTIIIASIAALITLILSLPLVGPIHTDQVISPTCSLDCGFSPGTDYATETQFGLPFPVASYQEYLTDTQSGTKEKKRENINWIAAMANWAITTAVLMLSAKAFRKTRTLNKAKSGR